MSRFEPRFDITGMCPACFGIVECKGGGNRLCLRRDPKPSHVAAVLDTYGGIRFVVSHRRAMRSHVRSDEVLIVVPKTLVHEPIGWGHIPGLIAHIEWYVGEWIKNNRPNEPHAIEAVKMYQLRQLERVGDKKALDLGAIVET